MIKTFGENVYQLLKDDLVDFSAATQWDDESNYVLNNLVHYKGVHYKLIVAANTTNDAPNCSDEWTVAGKFSTACYNELFSTTGGGLGKLLAWVIYAKAVPFYPNILGVTDFLGQDEKYKEKIQYHLGGIYSNIQTMYKHLLHWNGKNKCITIFSCDDGQGTELNKIARTTAW